MRLSPAPVRSPTRGARTATGPRLVMIARSGRWAWRTSRWRPSSVCVLAWPLRKAATSASTACANRARAPSRRTSVSGSENSAGWISLTTVSWVTACHSFGGEVEARTPPRYAASSPHAVTNFREYLALPPREPAPGPGRHHLFSGNRLPVWEECLARSPPCGRSRHQLHLDRIDLLDARDPDSPEQPQSRERLAKGGADPIAGIRHHGPEANTGVEGPLQFGQGDLGLGARGLTCLWHARAPHAFGILRPSLGQKQAQGDRDGHFALGQRERDQGLTIRILAQRRGVLRGHPDRELAVLGQGGVIDDQDGVWPTDQPIRLGQQFGFERLVVPGADGDEMVQLVVVGGRQPRGDRLQALALARPHQARHIKRAHAPACRMAQSHQERL